MTWKVGDKSRSEFQITTDIDFRVLKSKSLDFILSLDLAWN